MLFHVSKGSHCASEWDLQIVRVYNNATSQQMTHPDMGSLMRLVATQIHLAPLQEVHQSMMRVRTNDQALFMAIQPLLYHCH